ncbi:MAG TPA: tRNA lysidine(34) synthetase TilS [Gammaproteobacteria bacterium]|nr:tRNA lysidine(34) synthetase TilS [Gammaproteobacteria bacterium]
MNNSVQQLLAKIDAALNKQAHSRHFLLGLSGGLDSVVLLHAMTRLRERSGGSLQLRALHINHQLQEQSATWAQHCATLCESLAVEFSSIEVTINASAGIENAARQARYYEFEAALREDEVLLLAHHRDDQMETLLLRLIRGSGSRGLSGIPASRELGRELGGEPGREQGRGRLIRPLLGIDRDELLLYAEAAKLSWVEDGSNEDESFDRNYCRHTLLPLIEARWPGYRESWSKSAVLARESEALLQELAAMDLVAIATESRSVVSRVKLLALSATRRRNVLRFWLEGLGVEELGWHQLHQLSDEVVPSSTASVLIGGCRLHCYRETLHALAAAALETDVASEDLSGLSPLSPLPPLSSFSQLLAMPSEVELTNNGSLSFTEASGEGVAVDKLGAMTIRYRQGGEACRLLGRPNKSLKKILQEVEMQPWLRSRIPLLYSGDELAYIPGIGVSEAWAAKDGEAACLIDWQQPDLAL